ncbi:MAG: ribosomal protein [Flaviaesturariibacter sp.]|nr:ribosomal protein [Flaviaesturariibacter sp.]
MGTYQRFEELPIWMEARKLAFEVYQLTFHLPFANDFARVNQIRRACGSVADNSAEGYERDGRLEFINFLSIAKGSAGEVRFQLHRAADLAFITKTVLDEKVAAYKNLAVQIANFIKYLNTNTNRGIKFKDRITSTQ